MFLCKKRFNITRLRIRLVLFQKPFVSLSPNSFLLSPPLLSLRMSHFGYAPTASKGVASSSVAAANAFHRYQSQKAGPSTDIELEDGWAAVHLDGICKLQRILERGKGTFPNKEYIQLYTYGLFSRFACVFFFFVRSFCLSVSVSMFLCFHCQQHRVRHVHTKESQVLVASAVRTIRAIVKRISLRYRAASSSCFFFFFFFIILTFS
jgi:hypothetical protein